MAQTPPKQIGARIPAEWVEKLNQLSEATGKSQTQIVYEAVGKYLGEDVDTVDNELRDLRVRMEVVENRLGKLTATLVGSRS